MIITEQVEHFSDDVKLGEHVKQLSVLIFQVRIVVVIEKLAELIKHAKLLITVKAINLVPECVVCISLRDFSSLRDESQRFCPINAGSLNLDE